MSVKNPLNLPTERIDLPSKGIVYPEDHVLSQGFIDVIPPGARQEDILTNGNYLGKGIAVDKFLESILITDTKLDDMIPGDRDAFMIAARVLAFGKNYTTLATIDKKAEPVTFDLTTLQEREVDWSLFTKGVNEVSYTMPGGSQVKYKFITGNDHASMTAEEAAMKKTSPDYSADTSLFLKFALTEVNGSRATGDIRKFVDNPVELPLHQIKDLKKQITNTSPGYIWKANGVRLNKEIVEDLSVPYTVDFFWPRY